ncbi:MAG: hypothetical protein IJB17_04200 [Oscillospiraceae bacterium]|nr:hypothetical protein [Oscillospiraceae bacterium]
MEFLLIALVMGGTFFLCWLLDKGFTKLFRSKKEHQSGKSVRLDKKSGLFGLIAGVLGVAAIFNGLGTSALLIGGGCFMLVIAVGLIVYYMTFGVYYDDEGFLYTAFGKKTRSYRYGDIQSQQLYISYGNTVIELYMADGKAVQLQSGMTGVYPFLDTAYGRWLEQTGRKEEDCPFHDPANSCWFPPVEG